VTHASQAAATLSTSGDWAAGRELANAAADLKQAMRTMLRSRVV